MSLKFNCPICNKESKYFWGCNKNHRSKLCEIITITIVAAEIIKIVKGKLMRGIR